jgi:hypothetical protein
MCLYDRIGYSTAGDSAHTKAYLFKHRSGQRYTIYLGRRSTKSDEDRSEAFVFLAELFKNVPSMSTELLHSTPWTLLVVGDGAFGMCHTSKIRIVRCAFDVGL